MNELSSLDNPLRDFQQDGYFIVDQLFDKEEMDLLRAIARADRERGDRPASRRDGQGGAITLTVTNELGDNLGSAFVRCRRIVDTMEQLLGGEVYHYHH
jgi:ectoine hydroxylase